MIKLLIASAARIRRIINVMIAAHVSGGRFMSHTWPCDMMLWGTTSWCGNVGTQIEAAVSYVGCSNLDSRWVRGVHHTTSTASLLRAEWVWSRTHHHQVVALSIIRWAYPSSLWPVISLAIGLLVIVRFFIEWVLSWTLMWITLWRSRCQNWIMILMHLLLSCQRRAILRMLWHLMTISHILGILMLLIQLLISASMITVITRD